MSESNSYEFKGSIPKHYDEYLGPMFFEPYAIEVTNLVDPMKVNRALEIAAGTGRVTRHLKNRLSPGAKLFATDISPDMLEIAKTKFETGAVEWKVVDAQDIPFEENTFDLVVCCFGLMFIPDKEKAYREIKRVLKPGGKFLFSTWDKLEENGPSALYRKIVRPYLPQPVPAIYGLPFSMNDPEEITADLKAAGFQNILIQKIRKPCVSESARYAAEGLSTGGTVYNELMKTNPAAVTEIKNELEKQIREKYGDPMRAEMSALVGETEK